MTIYVHTEELFIYRVLIRKQTNMYTTRPLSLCRKELTVPLKPPAYSSGYLVITDEQADEEDTCCWSRKPMTPLPFPQNKIMKIEYAEYSEHSSSSKIDKVLFIPVLDLPLSSNRYYVIKASGRHKGEACTCSREEDMFACCFCNHIQDVKPRVLDHRDMYQQVEIIKGKHGGYTAKSVVPDGFPPLFPRQKMWSIYASKSYKSELGEALGLNVSLRMQLPELNFSIHNKSSTTVVVGKWYCPFVFIKDGIPKDQLKNSMYYEMTLEQTWEKIYTCENDNTKGNLVDVRTSVRKEVASLLGEEVVKEDTSRVDGFIWFTKVKHNEEVLSLGLSVAVVEQMRWVQEEGGWSEGGEKDVRVEMVDEFRGENQWKRFGCFMLVERFCSRRMDGTLLLTCDHRHIHQVRSKWE